MDKRKIMILGDFLPLKIKECEYTENISKKLNDSGYECILMSASWCKVDKKNIYEGYTGDLCKDIFSKKYYVDPIQLRYWNEDVILGIYSLSVKVIKKEKIEKVFFLDEIKYYPIFIMLKKRFPKMKIVCVIDTRSSKELFDDYIFPEIEEAFAEVDFIVSNKIILDAIKRLLNVPAEKLISETLLEKLIMGGKI